MKIDRSNYENWFIDYIDGNLNEDQIIQLESFLASNPDLKTELEEIRDVQSVQFYQPAVNNLKKDSLLRDPSQISDNQYELLCAAFIENDLSPEALEEFRLMTEGNSRREAILEMFRKTKLVPPELHFSRKKDLIRLTPIQRTIRISGILAGAAASVALLILFFIPSARNMSISNDSLAMQIPEEGRISHSFSVSEAKYETFTGRITRKDTPDLLTIIAENNISVPRPQTVEYENPSADNITTRAEEFTGPVPVRQFPVNYISMHTTSHDISAGLVRLNLPESDVTENERPVGKFIAKTFRETILRQEKPEDSPLKGYEIAEAGVSGLNKLFGWQMALEKNADPAGEIRSVRFSSRLIKVQAPVNRHESSE